MIVAADSCDLAMIIAPSAMPIIVFPPSDNLCSILQPFHNITADYLSNTSVYLTTSLLFMGHLSVVEYIPRPERNRLGVV